MEGVYDRTEGVCERRAGVCECEREGGPGVWERYGETKEVGGAGVDDDGDVVGVEGREDTDTERV